LQTVKIIRGEIEITLENRSSGYVNLPPGTKIAELIFQKFEHLLTTETSENEFKGYRYIIFFKMLKY